MKSMSARDAKNAFGMMIDLARAAPVAQNRLARPQAAAILPASAPPLTETLTSNLSFIFKPGSAAVTKAGQTRAACERAFEGARAHGRARASLQGRIHGVPRTPSRELTESAIHLSESEAGVRPEAGPTPENHAAVRRA